MAAKLVLLLLLCYWFTNLSGQGHYETFVDKNTGKFGILHYRGSKSDVVTCPAIYNEISGDYRYPYKGKVAFVVREKGKYGLIDYKGKPITPFTYDSIYYTIQNERFYGALNPKVKQGNKFGVLTAPNYDLTIPLEYDSIYQFSSSHNSYFYFKKGKEYGLINNQNKVIFTSTSRFKYTHRKPPKDSIGDYILDHRFSEKDGLEILMLRNGKNVLVRESGRKFNQKLSDIGAVPVAFIFSGGYIVQQRRHTRHATGNQYGNKMIVDADEKVVCNCDFRYNEVINNYRTTDRYCITKHNGKYGIWDNQDEEERYPTQYDSIIHLHSDGWAVGKSRENEWQLIDLSTRNVFFLTHNYPIHPYWYSQYYRKRETWFIKQNDEGKYGLVNIKNETITPCIYDSIPPPKIWHTPDKKLPVILNGEKKVIVRNWKTLGAITHENEMTKYERYKYMVAKGIVKQR
jgi:hypothetical protein